MGIGSHILEVIFPILKSLEPLVPGEIFPYFFTLEIFQRALIAALLVTVVAGYLGNFLLIRNLVALLLVRVLHQPRNQGRVFQFKNALVQFNLVNPRTVHKQLFPLHRLVEQHGFAHHVHASSRFNLVLVVECNRVNSQTVFKEPIL